MEQRELPSFEHRGHARSPAHAGGGGGCHAALSGSLGDREQRQLELLAHSSHCLSTLDHSPSSQLGQFGATPTSFMRDRERERVREREHENERDK